MEALLGEGGNYTSVSASVCPAHHALVGRVGFKLQALVYDIFLQPLPYLFTP